jgi:eukaryotic-like serine/threonine-protein kinase
MNRNPAITPPPAESSAVPGSAPQTARFVPGYVLAGRYRMISHLGTGGVGEVWRADDLLLETPVALKLIYSPDPDARHRILSEARLARQLTHPAICRVFDVGEGEDEIFYSMELIDGEDLATLVRRVGRLPSEKVIDIGLQLCDGLAAAHAQGILDRDLKPANVLIDQDGFVRITDFGIAATGDRSDIYALGLILYQLVVGRFPLDAASETRRQPPKPSTLIDDVDPQLEHAIMKAIAADPRDRPASVYELSQLLNSPATRWPRWTWVAAASTAGAALLLVAAIQFLKPAARPLTAQDTIILADFQNTTGDPLFDSALKVALAVALEQSPFLKVFPDARVRETLRLMERPPDERVTRSVAREVARREQLKALVTGSIASLGSHYVLALEAINAETGEVVAREQIEADAKEQVLTALGTATSRLREELGESLAVIERFDVPLAQATTGSLDALHSYSLALEGGQMVPRLEAVPHLLRAIELDPNFAMAHALLSGVYANTGRSGEAPVFSRRAFELRDRVSERERFFISWRYHLDAEQAWDKALDLALSWTRTYPREAFAFNSLGLASAAFGRHDQAVAAFREAIRLDARFLPPHGNLAGSLIALNRFDQARELVNGAAAPRVDAMSVRRMAYLLAFLNGDAEGMTHVRDLVLGTSDAMWASTWEARTAAFAGRVDAAHEMYQRGIHAALAARLHELGAQWTMEDAEAHAIAGQCDEARKEAAAGLELSRDNFTLERAARTLVLCDAPSDASRLSAELATRFPAATLTRRIHLPVIAAVQALRRGDYRRAIDTLEPVKPYDYAPAAEFWPLYLRGEAYLGLKDGPSAAAQFQGIIDHRGAAPASPLYLRAQRGAARAATIGELTGVR